SSPFMPLRVSESYVTVKLERAAIERGRVGHITARLEHRKPIPGEAVAMLGRLPYGVLQLKPYPKIDAEDEDVRFRVHVTEDCLVGQYKDIFCQVVVEEAGQEIRQQTGSGILRVDPERRRK
ncbi:MAG: hypothetical protein AAF492_28255, partial [Verrucomicrobiota bacterium]